MACKTLKVTKPTSYPKIVDATYGFAKVEGENTIFDMPCEAQGILGNSEAVGIVFTIENAPSPVNIRLNFSYLRPGETTKRTLGINYTLTNGVYSKFIRHPDLKYKEGEYTGLTLGTLFP